MLTIAYLGPAQTNTHVAALAKFGRKAAYLHTPTIDDVFHRVERREADFGVVPVENSLEGAVTHTLDRFIDFIDTPVKIHGEIERHIRHALILHRGVKLIDVGLVLSHPQALAQCRSWLDRNLPDANRWETFSTAEAVDLMFHKKVLQDPKNQRHWVSANVRYRAAIGRRELARGRKLRVISIPEQRENKTRFLVLGLGEPSPGRYNKTSILFAVKDRPGALHDALVVFKRNRINLTKIESRPSKQKAWEYLFFIDVEGHESEPRLKRAIKALQRSTSLLRILGSYPVTTR
ncbi:MAG: prephenate dehydratase [Candidatus Omnitrophica bacterium]|nr:prephenate dehydratase [Candidatus Omnitrophota bacterium]